MKFKLLDLPYKIDALEPYMSRETLKVHHGKLHQKYVDTTNQLIQGTDYADMTLEEIVIESSQRKIDERIYNNAAQLYNHNFFWPCLSPEKKMKLSPAFQRSIESSFGSFRVLNDNFKKTVMNTFGSGWVWLVKDHDGMLEILPLKDAECPIVHYKLPLLACDVWEHAYFLDYKQDREKYFENYWQMIDWSFVDKNFNEKVFNPEARPVLNDSFIGGLTGMNLGFS